MTQGPGKRHACHQEVSHGDWVQDGAEAIVPLAARHTHTRALAAGNKQKHASARKGRTLTIGAHGNGMFDQTGGGMSGGTCPGHGREEQAQTNT